MAAAAERTSFVALDGVSLRYPGAATAAVDRLHVSASRGEVVTLLGPSGCGKTTALRLIAGLELADEGTISLDGRDVTDWPPEQRRMGFVFQNYALFPHLTVGENVAFGLRVRKLPASEIARTVAETLELVDLTGFESRRIDRMSGGQQQRVALARALAIKPDVLLLDEPLSNLDASLREQTREALRHVLERLGVTTFFVTHDQSEAFAFSDRIVLMRAGRVVETGSPERLYSEPESAFTAEFLGAANVLPAVVDASGASVTLGDGPHRVGVGSWSKGARGEGRRVALVARPESLELAASGAANSVPGAVVDRVFLGASYRLSIAVEGLDRPVRALGPRLAVGDPVVLRLPEEALRVIEWEE